MKEDKQPKFIIRSPVVIEAMEKRIVEDCLPHWNTAVNSVQTACGLN